MIKTATTGNTTNDAFSLVVKTVPGLFYRANGVNKGADAWIQLHDSATVPANTAVPVKSWIAQSNFEFNEHVSDGISCVNGICLVMSSTPSQLTIATDVKSHIECEYEVSDTLATTPTLSMAGDITTGRNSLQVWADASGPKRLVDLQWTNLEAGSCYLQAFGMDNPANGTQCIWQSPLVLTTATGKNFFGFPGRYMYQQKTVDLTNHVGLTLAVSSTTGVLTIGTAGTSLIQAHYY